MTLSDFDLSIIYLREDGSFVIDQGTYHVPNEGEWSELWQEVSAYAAEHPAIVMPEPDDGARLAEMQAHPLEGRLAEIEDALVELASIITGGE